MPVVPPALIAERQERHSVAYRDHRSYVLAVLRRRCRWLEPDELEGILHDAWTVLLEKEERGVLDVAQMRSQQVRAYLVQSALHKALDEGRRAGRTRNEPIGDRDDFAATSAAPEEIVDAGMEGARIREIVAELTARQQAIIKLRFYFDRSPDEIRRLLSLTDRAYRRDLERAMRAVSEQYELVREGRFCDGRASLIRAYVAGIAGPNRMREAREHLMNCPACRQFALELREAAGRFAATLPRPAIAIDGRGPLTQLADLLTGGRDAALHAGTDAKQQVVALSTRVDPSSPLVVAGARPGALAAAVAGCIALSGGAATYCAVVGVPFPRGALSPADTTKPAAQTTRSVATVARRPAPSIPARIAPAAQRPTTTTQAPAPAKAKTTTTTSPKRQETQARRAAADRRETVAAQEFGAEGSGTPVQQPAAQNSTPAPAVVAAPSEAAPPANAPPGEFDP